MSDLFCLQKYKRKLDGTSWRLNLGFVLNKLINFHLSREIHSLFNFSLTSQLIDLLNKYLLSTY